MTEETGKATPHAELIADLMNSNNPKNEREHAAVREIKRLREAFNTQQEPVAWMTINDYGEEDDIHYENPEGHLLDGWTYEPLYTSSPKVLPEQPKYRRGSRLVCLETEEFCDIHISGTDRQWVKFPDTHIGVYTNEQVAELFELLPANPEQEPPKETL